MARSTTIFTTGVAGSGKSYVRCARFLCNEFLPDRTGTHYSNFPVNMEGLREVLAEVGVKGERLEEMLARVRVIPWKVTEEWRMQTNLRNRGPWDFFRDPELCGLPAVKNERGETVADLSRVHIAIDEWHNFAGSEHPPEVLRKWQEWLGELRHAGATFEGLSQSPGKLASVVRSEAGQFFEVNEGSAKKDPILCIEYGDWKQLWAKLTGRYTGTSWLLEKVKVGSRWRVQWERKYQRDPKYFKVYDSHTASIGTGQSGQEEKLEWERFGWLRFIAWFLDRNAFQMAKRGPLIALSAGILICLAIWGQDCGKVFTLALGFITGGQEAATRLEQSKKVDAKKPARTTERRSESEDTAASTEETGGSRSERRTSRSVAKGSRERRPPSAPEDLEPVEWEEAEMPRLVLLTPRRAYFANGVSAAVGQEVELAKGVRGAIREIDFVGCGVWLESGEWVPLGRHDAAGADQDSVRGDVRSSGGGDEGDGRSRVAERGSADVPRGRYDRQRVPSVGGVTESSLDRVSGTD